MALRDEHGRPLRLEPIEGSRARRIVADQPPAPRRRAPLPVAAPAPAPEPVEVAARAEPARRTAPGDEPLRDYLGRVLDLDGTAVATDDELAEALGRLPVPMTGAQIAADPAIRAAYARPRRDGRTIVLGDSIDGAVFGWFPYLTVLSGQRVKYLRNAGVGGNNTTQMLARIQADVIAYRPDVCILGGPTNDHHQGFSEATTRNNYRAMVGALRAAGVQVVFRNCPPTDTGGAGPWATQTAHRQVVTRHNAWLARWAEVEGIPLLDLYSPLVDPATGGYKGGGNGGAYSADGIHPREVGYREAAEAMIAAGLPDVFSGRVQLGTSIFDDPTLIGNGCFTTDATADGAADTWNFTGHTARSLVPGAAPVVGNWQRITANGSTAVTLFQNVPGADPRRVPGNRVAFAFRARSVGAGVRARVLQTGGPTFDLGPFALPVEGVFYVETVVDPAATDLRFYAMAEPGVTQFDVAQARAVDLTALDAL